MKRNAQAISLPSSLILTALFCLSLVFFGNFSGGASFYTLFYGILLSTLLFLIFYTGRINPWRRIFFVTIAMMFFPSFIHQLIVERGHMIIDPVQYVNAESPFCHLVIPQTLIPLIFKKTVIFPARLTNHLTSVYSLIAICLFMTLFLGRGWCSWICFYGGWDDGASRLAKKTRLKLDDRASWISHLPLAVLLFLVLGSLITMTAIYCEWFCPYKLITEFDSPETVKSVVSMVMMILSFLALLIVLPFLTRKRFSCGLVCPYGTLQRIVGSRVSPFEIAVDKDKCNDCGLCRQHCPTFSMGTKKVKRSCTLCGECIDVCPKGALEITLGGKDKGLTKGPSWLKELIKPRNIFILCAFNAGMIISFGFALDTLKMVVSIFTGADL